MSKIIKFTATNKELLNIAFEIRRKVFIEEQNVSEEEEFEFEEDCMHFLIYYKKRVVGTARHRQTNKGVKLERFAILAEGRGKGYGYDILRFVLNDARALDKPVYLNAQVDVVDFYKKQGFVITGTKFIEAGIEHYPMTFEDPINLENALKKAVCRR